MKVLVIGGGGREHALAWKLKQDEGVQQVFVAPGNAGTARDPALTTLDITDKAALRSWAQAEGVALTVVGPEAPLAAVLTSVGLSASALKKTCHSSETEEGSS